ncbi:MAG: hypothetical protein ACJ74U_13330 [Jatrophihabitantaceae bacterium]
MLALLSAGLVSVLPVSSPFVAVAAADTAATGSFNGAAGVSHGGSMIHHTYAVSPSTPVVGPSTSVSWWPNGYKAYDYNNWDHNVLTEFSWSVPGAPGYFWMYVRSPVSHTTQRGLGAIYRFGSSLKFPGDLERPGWSW